jgi:hypothetical protein
MSNLPMKEYKVFNLAEITPAGNPDPGFMYLFPRGGQWWQRNSSGEETALTPVDLNQTDNPAWVSTTTYTLEKGDIYVLHKDKLWKLVAATSTGHEPGSSTQWEEVSFSAMQHVQNTDLKTGRHSTVLFVSGLKDLTSNDYKTKNYFIIGAAGPPNSDPKWLDLQTINGNERIDHEFIVQNGTSSVVSFENTANQYVGQTLELPPGHFAVFHGALNTPVGIRTCLKYSSVSTGGGGGGTNPFDQDLNKANNAEFAAVKVSGMASATPVVATFDADGQAGKREVANLAELHIEALTWKEGNQLYQMRIINGAITLIPL